ncbi:MAG: Phox homologous domain-containing protein [Benjaminiella poitrasii]|nr:MAG: Phox homologous domain-containing protein [Benjaminiella poitrasii]
MDTIQAILINETETRHEPKAHTVYRIDVQAAVREWRVWKRYSDFTKLHEQLTRTFPDHDLPGQLPQKRIFPPTFNAPDKIEDRRQGLETYLRSILSSRDSRWRQTEHWSLFLSPSDEGAAEKKAIAKPVTTTMILPVGAWLDEYDGLVAISREIRSLIHRRNNHSSQNQVPDAMQCDMKAKRGLMTLSAQLAVLETSLSQEGEEIADGEVRRREDQLSNLKIERDVLSKLITAPPVTARQQHGSLSSSSSHTPDTTTKKGKTRIHNEPASKKSGRAFGAAFLKQQLQKETRETKGLDNQGLLNYQNQVMSSQDSHIEQFSQILQRQKELGVAIHIELENQIDLIESLDSQVDKTQKKLVFANKKLATLN